VGAGGTDQQDLAATATFFAAVELPMFAPWELQKTQGVCSGKLRRLGLF
jgi:hypothetical protein